MDSVESKKKERKPIKKGTFVILCCGIALIGTAVGGVGGYLCYNALAPEATFEVATSSFQSILNRTENKSSDEIIKEFANDQENLANYVFYKYATSKESLTLGYSLVKNFSGNQVVHSATYSKENYSFNQNISATEGDAIVKVGTAFRYYDDYTNNIIAYEYSTEDEWKKDTKPTKNYTYDEFIAISGILNHGIYTIDKEEKYVSDGIAEGNQVLGCVAYVFSSKSVSSSSIEKEGNGYCLTLSLIPGYASYYYSRQVQYSGGLEKKPSYGSNLINLKIYFDQDLNLYKSISEEAYSVTKMSMKVDVTATTLSKYYSSSETNLKVNKKEVKVPEMGESFAFSIDENGDFL